MSGTAGKGVGAEARIVELAESVGQRKGLSVSVKTLKFGAWAQ